MRLPRFVNALDRKLLRDLWGMKGQALAIAFVIAGGVAVHLLAEGMLTSSSLLRAIPLRGHLGTRGPRSERPAQ
jgi:hypothetical protein